MISGKTTLIAHIGYPTETFKAPLIYNPWFDVHGIDAIVVPMGVKAEDYPSTLRAVFKMTNIGGALITMPHKVTTLTLADEASTTAKIAGSANALRKDPDGKLIADMFDGTGFTRGLARKGSSLAAEGVAALVLFDKQVASAQALAERLKLHYGKLDVRVGPAMVADQDLIVNATPLGMKDGDPLPFDVSQLAPSTFVGEVVMKREITPLLAAAKARGCQIQVGTDMLFEMIPAYLEFFGFGTATPEELRAIAKVAY
ncbi:MAG: shikimate dehydrogenase [Betaproteobacteria bacterium]|nr:MAG: shikimate dehydrogenase [Betaproteobacteria bacterium]